MEQRARQLLEKVDELGGAAKAIAAGFFQDEIAQSAYAQQLRVESGQSVVVGVNRFQDGTEPPLIPSPDFTRLAIEQKARLREVRACRDPAALERAMSALRGAAPSYSSETGSPRAPLMPLIIDAVRARASVGEISDALVNSWGRYRGE